MALVLGDIVSMSLEDYENQNGLLGPLVQAQPPRFGRVATATGGPPATTVDVLWDDGRFEQTIPVDALDKIEPPDAGVVSTLQGFVLKTNPAQAAQAESPEFQGIAIAFYTRDQNGEGSPTETLCLMRLNFFGTYRELLASTLTPVTGR